MRTHRRGGFTLFQLLIVLAILAILLGLLLPFLAEAREQAVRKQSQNNLKQIALGCHSYHDTANAFPPGVDDKGFCATAYLLPYIEQTAAFQMIDFTKSVD